MSEKRQLDDYWLIQQVQSQNDQAFTQLYDKYNGIVFGVILSVVKKRSDAEEVLQEVFLTIWNKAASYSTSRGTVYTWLLTIARNRAVDRVRSKAYKITQQNFDNEVLDRVSDTTSLSQIELEEVKDRKEHMTAALQELSDDQRQALEACYYQGLTHIEAAEKLGLPLGTLKTRVRSALQKLSEKLKGVAI